MIRRLIAGAGPALLPVAGLGCITAAAWTLHLAAGLAALGASCLLLEWRFEK